MLCIELGLSFGNIRGSPRWAVLVKILMQRFKFGPTFNSGLRIVIERKKNVRESLAYAIDAIA